MATERVRKFRSGFVAVGTVAATIPTTVASAKMVGTGEDHEAFLCEVGVRLFRLGQRPTGGRFAPCARWAKAGLLLEMRRNAFQHFWRNGHLFAPTPFRRGVGPTGPAAGIGLTAERALVFRNGGEAAYIQRIPHRSVLENRRQTHSPAIADPINAQVCGSGTVLTMENPSISALPLSTSIRM